MALRGEAKKHSKKMSSKFMAQKIGLDRSNTHHFQVKYYLLCCACGADCVTSVIDPSKRTQVLDLSNVVGGAAVFLTVCSSLCSFFLQRAWDTPLLTAAENHIKKYILELWLHIAVVFFVLPLGRSESCRRCRDLQRSVVLLSNGAVWIRNMTFLIKT